MFMIPGKTDSGNNDVWSVAASGILFGGHLKIWMKKIIIKRELEYIELLKKKIEVLQFSFTSFQILNCYMIVHYEYLLSLWVGMIILFC